MDKRKKWHTAIELGKDLLIVLLTCSALWILGHGAMGQRLDLPRENVSQVTQTQDAATGHLDTARPMRITVTLQDSPSPMRCSLQYDDAAVNTVFQQVAGLLMETLSSAETPQTIHREDWERALNQAPGYCFDFQGLMPLSALTGWLGVERSMPDAVVRRMLLTVWEDSVALYYYDYAAGNWCRCTSQVVSVVQLEDALTGLTADGTYYAFESDVADVMAPDTVLTPVPNPLPIYAAANPVAGGRSALEVLMTDLGFSLSGCVFYTAAGEEVARNGSDTLRLSKNGVVEYQANENGAQQFPVTRIAGESRVFSMVETCRQLLQQVVRDRCGQARLYLTRAEERNGGWHLEFGYSLNGVPVRLKDAPAACFDISGEHIVAFTIALRSYTAGEETCLVLPPVQAAAAMSALSLEGRELQLMYQDGGEEQVLPNWTAVLDEVR